MVRRDKTIGANGTFNAAALPGVGASGSKRGDESCEATLNFAASPNRNGITVGLRRAQSSREITGIAKKGWE